MKEADVFLILVGVGSAIAILLIGLAYLSAFLNHRREMLTIELRHREQDTRCRSGDDTNIQVR